MLTPYFSVTQDSEFVHVAVKVSHVRFSAAALEMVVDHDVFIFSLAPYYLRLRFPHALVDDERASAAFDLAAGAVNIRVPKAVPGQDFPELDLTAKLLARKEGPAPQGPLIEELDVGAAPAEPLADAQAHDWEIRQEVDASGLGGVRYGFNNAYSGVVGVSTSNGNDINELGDPERALPAERIVERLVRENIKFDAEYYAADYIMARHPLDDDDKSYAEILRWKCPGTRAFLLWYRAQQQKPESEREAVMPVEFTPEEHERMLQLPKKTYLLDAAVVPQLWVLVASLLFAYMYDMRENEGEHNIESAWTVGKLAPQFAFLDAQLHVPSDASPSILRAAVITGVRRALAYPYHRHYATAMKAWDDVYYCLRGGKRMVLKCLLDLRELFRYHDIYYVYDKIWLEDVCRWVLSDVSENAVRELAHDLKKETAALQKDEVTFEKIDDTQAGDAMIALSVADLEQMADDSYAAYAAQS